jgi:hypothetical protein
MIRNNTERGLIAEEWHSLRATQARLSGNSTAIFGSGGYWITQMYDDIYALLLIYGFSVLEHALQQMGAEGTIGYQGNKLGRLFKASRKPALWPDGAILSIVEEGKSARDDLAHRRIVPASAKTFAHLDAIEATLIQSKVLNGPVTCIHTTSVTRTSDLLDGSAGLERDLGSPTPPRLPPTQTANIDDAFRTIVTVSNIATPSHRSLIGK